MPSPKRVAHLALRPVVLMLNLTAGLIFLAVCLPAALVARIWPKRFDIGIGPEPLINTPGHKRALELYGYKTETYVGHVYFITSEFDYRGDLAVPRYLGFARSHFLTLRALFRYRALYIYFNGGPLHYRRWLRALEPLLFRIAGTKVVVMPYGGDVQDLSRSHHLPFKHVVGQDYPRHRLLRRTIDAQIDRWTRHADHVISGLEWVDYMYHWDTLLPNHFAIDTELWSPEAHADTDARPFRILHAPNHRAIKGTEHFIRAVDELRDEGVDVELVILEGVPNDRIREVIGDVDAVAEQLIIGWYAMFGLEAMAMEKPLICYLRPDLVELFTIAGSLKPGEIPIVSCGPLDVKESIRRLAGDREEARRLGRLCREYVLRHHSIEAMGAVFDGINRSIGIVPRRGPTRSDERIDGNSIRDVA